MYITNYLLSNVCVNNGSGTTMTHLDVSNSSTDSSSESTSDSSSSGSSSSSSGSGSSSSDSESSVSEIAVQDIPIPPLPKSPVKDEEPKKKEEPKRRPSKLKVSSSSEDDTPKVVSPKTLPPRRRNSTKPKSATAVLAKGKQAQNNRQSSGAKTPKPIPKTIQKATKAETSSHKKKSIFSPDNSSESEPESKSSKSPKGSSPKSKRSSRKSSEEKELDIPLPVDNDDSNNSNISNSNNSNSNNSNSNHSNSNRSISNRSISNRSNSNRSNSNRSNSNHSNSNHSNSNHSNSNHSNSNHSNTNSTHSISIKSMKSIKSSTNSNTTSSTKDSTKRKNGNRPNGPPPKKTIESKSVSSCSSSQSSVESVSSDSDSEPTPKKDSSKTGTSKASSNSSNSVKLDTRSKSGDSGDSNTTGTMTRKLTRSLSARVSRLATKTKINTDTDSEVEEKVNHVDKSKDSYKRNGRGTRGGGAGGAAGRSPAPPPPDPLLSIPLPPSERTCPVRGCDSQGHLGGKSDRHFTFDACPIYHNVTPAWCVAAMEERAAAGAARRRALVQLHQRPRPVPSLDQRAYQLKVKDMRSKWKGSQELKEKLAASGNDELNEDREPILEGFTPDYDLKLFREAQALAAIKIEEELGDLPTDRGTRYVVMGKHMMEVWYQSPYPGAAGRAPRLFVCEFCLNHHRSAPAAARHSAKCVWRHPPGDEVYRKDSLSVWQVDGRKHKQYCQQLCLLAKFFLDHKTLYYDVEPFLFYVMTCADSQGCHVVGYFSKEKNSFQNYNVSCILTLPPYQRQGYGRLLIDFSYLLTKVEGKVGSPETPLSDLGLISYRSYWKEALLKRLCSAPGPTLCIRDLSKDLAIASSDIVSTLQERGLMKYWKGKHIVLKKQEVLEEVSRRAARQRSVDPSCLRWWGGAGPPR